MEVETVQEEDGNALDPIDELLKDMLQQQREWKAVSLMMLLYHNISGNNT
jgi:hypothetical protein